MVAAGFGTNELAAPGLAHCLVALASPHGTTVSPHPIRLLQPGCS
jgi:hypothetical protein